MKTQTYRAVSRDSEGLKEAIVFFGSILGTMFVSSALLQMGAGNYFTIKAAFIGCLAISYTGILFYIELHRIVSWQEEVRKMTLRKFSKLLTLQLFVASMVSFSWWCWAEFANAYSY